jgi:hypothetical protein
MILQAHRAGPIVGGSPNRRKPMRNQLWHVAVLIAALGVSTSMFAATLV